MYHEWQMIDRRKNVWYLSTRWNHEVNDDLLANHQVCDWKSLAAKGPIEEDANIQ